MRCRLFIVVTMLSLLLCFSTLLLWARSFRTVTYLIGWSQPRDVTATIGVGVVMIEYTPAGQLEQYDEGSPRGHLFYSVPIVKPGVPRQFVDVVPDSPSWGFQRAAISTDEAHYEMKTPRQWAGFGYGKVIDRSLAPGFDMFYTIKLPLWIVAAVFLALPAGRTVSTLRQLRRRARGLCPCCGYDLRASEGRCPECGTPIPAEVPP